ncbi:hypothetical protein 056SW001B_48 [Bacillus phage 056SW001B]|uniref:Uncharacterized protein n=2 Tax=Gettysburgvirus TaxID=3425034 RepID=A0A5J6T423_9CAUD|nr:hypothetical protein 019DV002_46 [Bacillus phage 019DV002]QFG05274.1 hypothetical protein 019DV004_46 [Bacillus phage 019DV004]QFG05887.1 hypothetical protein 276BB001_48 [Bacillus phage 276BB001]QFG05968.1 hypothetical protein 280BB001_48 [Bacillus phage 280BB001]QFR56513.1 hypothetical protein 056SW001B_48 [Bacillus phage 056SW001B]QZA70117.1 hypothetical protein 274BB002_48 [Bacillus phage 274BB002]
MNALQALDKLSNLRELVDALTEAESQLSNEGRAYGYPEKIKYARVIELHIEELNHEVLTLEQKLENLELI